MPPLDTWANYAEIFGAITVVGGLLFAGIQIKLAREQRREAAAMTLLASYMASGTFPRAARLVMKTEDLVEACKDPEVGVAVDEVNMLVESIGLMVYNRSIPLRLVAEWGAGGITRLWKRIEPLHTIERDDRGGTSPFDWWAWLATMIERHHPEMMTTSALDRHDDWVPN